MSYAADVSKSYRIASSRTQFILYVYLRTYNVIYILAKKLRKGRGNAGDGLWSRVDQKAHWVLKLKKNRKK